MSWLYRLMHLNPAEDKITIDKPIMINGTSIFVYAGDPATHISATRIGDLCIDYTNGKLYIAGATGTGHWDIVTSA